MAQQKEGKVIRMEEVRKHNSLESTWFVIHNKVYDVSKFLDDHPGGAEVLLEHSGKDATDPFEDVGHSSDARSLMVEYCIGDLHPDDHIGEEGEESRPQCKLPPCLNNWYVWAVPAVLVLGAVAVYRYRAS